ncbi:MAG: helix-turn-helix domain-containing protein [Balneola sp.]
MKVLKDGTYYGSMNTERRFNGLIISEYDYLIERTDWHYHENPYFMYVLEGSLYDVNKKQKTPCPAGTFLLHNWQEAHFNSKESKNARGFHIEFEQSWFEKNELATDLWEGSKLIKNPMLHHILARIYSEFRFSDEYSIISCELLLAELCDNLEKEKIYHVEEKPSWLNMLLEIIHHDNGPINLASLSKKVGVHPGHISRSVPKYFSTTLGDYIRQIKIKSSIELLLSTKKSLTDISYECGFSDQSHFIRTFKAYIGISPGHFLKKCR